MARIRPASHYQRRDSAIRLVAVSAYPKIKRRAREGLKHLSTLVDTKMAARLAASGRWRDINRDAINWGQFREVMKAVFAAIADAYSAGAGVGVGRINRAFSSRGRRVVYRKTGAPMVARPGGGAHRGSGVSARTATPTNLSALFDISKDIGSRFDFDTQNAETQTWLRAEQDRLIRELEQEARDAVEATIFSGIEEGRSAEEVAEDIRRSISLTARQADAVANYRNMLESLDSGALQRRLRNPEYDEIVRQAIEDEQDLESALVDKLTDEYQERYLDYRAKTIADTESTRAASDGLHDSYRQAIERGALPANAIRRFWKVDLDERTCPICLSIPDMNPDGVGVDEPFESIAGQFYDPPEPHPNCRCEVEYQTDLDMVPQDDEDATAETVTDL